MFAKSPFHCPIALESANFSTFEEGEEWWSTITLGMFSLSAIEINATIIDSLKDKLTVIFKITGADGNPILGEINSFRTKTIGY